MSFDEDELSELMGLFILNKFNKIVHVDSHCLYRDDGLIIAPANRKANDRIFKNVFKVFQGIDFDITVHMSKIFGQYLDIEFNLSAGTVSPYTKP